MSDTTKAAAKPAPAESSALAGFANAKDSSVFKSYENTAAEIACTTAAPKKIKVPAPQEKTSTDPKDYTVIIGVTGTPKWADKKTFHKFVCLYLQRFKDPILFISDGITTGASQMVQAWCLKYSFPCLVIAPDWDKYGKRAGFLRNDVIAENITHLLSFFDGYFVGSQDLIDKSMALDVPCKVVAIPRQEAVKPGEEVSWVQRTSGAQGSDKKAQSTISKDEMTVLGANKCVAKPVSKELDWIDRAPADPKWAPRRVWGAPEHPEQQALSLQAPTKAHVSASNPYHPNHKDFKAYKEGFA